jgi:hypothetical protein
MAKKEEPGFPRFLVASSCVRNSARALVSVPLFFHHQSCNCLGFLVERPTQHKKIRCCLPFKSQQHVSFPKRSTRIWVCVQPVGCNNECKWTVVTRKREGVTWSYVLQWTIDVSHLVAQTTTGSPDAYVHLTWDMENHTRLNKTITMNYLTQFTLI